MKTLLVTGGAGFIGSNFIKYFLRRNKNFLIINMDKLSHSTNIENMREFEDCPRHQFIRGDICNQDFVSFVFKKYKPDYIVNFAAESQAEKSSSGIISASEANIMGTLSLLENARTVWQKNKFSGNKFIQVSTDEVYGNLSSRSDAYFEDSPLNPETPFAASKAAADMLCQTYCKAYGMPVIITRSCNIYGPGQQADRFIPYCIKCALDDKPAALKENSMNTGEWIYVTDHSIALIRTLFYGSPGEVYNIGTGEEISNLDISKKVFAMLNKPINIVENDKKVELKRCAINSYKLRNNLGWSHKMTLDEGLKETIRWYRD